MTRALLPLVALGLGACSQPVERCTEDVAPALPVVGPIAQRLPALEAALPDLAKAPLISEGGAPSAERVDVVLIAEGFSERDLGEFELNCSNASGARTRRVSFGP